MPTKTKSTVVQTLKLSEKQPKNKVRFDNEDGTRSEYLTAEENAQLDSPSAIKITIAAA